MITRVSVKNFKSLRDVTVDLGRLTVLVGPNASGKSSILRSLDLLCYAFTPVPLEEGGVRANHLVRLELWRAATGGTHDPIELAAEVGGRWYRYTTSILLGPHSRADGKDEDDRVGHTVSSDHESNGRSRWVPIGVAPPPLGTAALLRLEPARLTDPSPGPSGPAAMAADGSGLHPALASMALSDPDSWQRLQEELRRIVPTVTRVRHTGLTPDAPIGLLFDTVAARGVPADLVSEGALRVVGLLAALFAPARPGLLLLDDLDCGLHPLARRKVVDLLRRLLADDPGLQIVATTHSPYLLNYVDPEQVRMTHLREDGSTACAPLSQHPRFPKWKNDLDPGEMWGVWGERWVAEPEAAE